LLIIDETAIVATQVVYRAFDRFGEAKFPDGGSVLGLSQFSVLPKLPPKNDAQLKRGQNQLENKQPALLI